MESSENLIKLSREDHIQAHQLLFEIYEDNRDQGAVYMLSGRTDEALKIFHQQGAAANHKLLKKEGRNFWNSKFQKEMAKRSMDNPKAIIIRSEAGKIGRKMRKSGIAINKKDRYLFFFKEDPLICVLFFFLNCETGGDIVRILNQIQPSNLQRVTELLKGTRKVAYGWSCKKIDNQGILDQNSN